MTGSYSCLWGDICQYRSSEICKKCNDKYTEDDEMENNADDFEEYFVDYYEYINQYADRDIFPAG